MLKYLIKKILPTSFQEYIQREQAFIAWKRRGYLEHSPQVVKQGVFLKYGIKGACWVETGTYLGATTDYLSGLFPHVYSIEPEPELYSKARKRFEKKNITLYNDTSENVFPSLLKELSGDVNFWLDGHYSAGITFQGEKDCPVEDELNAIEMNFKNFSGLSILIDDVRCFLSESTEYSDYPSIDYLVDWARKMNMSWRIEHDIFIMKKG